MLAEIQFGLRCPGTVQATGLCARLPSCAVRLHRIRLWPRYSSSPLGQRCPARRRWASSAVTEAIWVPRRRAGGRGATRDGNGGWRPKQLRTSDQENTGGPRRKVDGSRRDPGRVGGVLFRPALEWVPCWTSGFSGSRGQCGEQREGDATSYGPAGR